MKTLKLRFAAVAAVVLGLVFAASATTYYVDASRPDNNDDGLSEATAKRDISAAIFSSAAGDVILVKPGTYTERISTGKELTIRSTDGAEKTFIFTENTEAVSIANGAKTTMIDGFTLSSVGSYYAIWGGTFTNCVIAKCGGAIQSCRLQRSTVAYNDQGVRDAYNVNVSDDCLVWGNPVKTETEPNPCFLDPENFDFRLRAFSPEAYTNPRLGYYQGSLIEGQIVRVAVDGAGKLEGKLFNLVAVGGNITLKCATTSPRSVERWLDENGETIVNGGDYELAADSLTIKNVTADRRITAYFERKTWYVNGDTGDDAGNDGLSEGNPFKTITKALTSALDLDTILVAEGTYVEGYDEIDDHKYPKLRVTDGRHLTIRATGARAETIIDGGNETSCLWLNDKQTINTNVVVDGFTLQNGQASWLTYVGAIGGGAFGGLLRNCTIRNCTSGSGDSGGGGGAAFARLENCTVTGCKAHSEGGALRGCDAEGCVIRENSMGGTSSYARGCATVYGTLVNCLIADNEFESTVVSGSGAVYQSELYGCTVAGNRNNASSNRNGAGVYGESSYTKLFNTIVYGNVSDGQPDELQNVSGADLATCCTNDPSFKDAASGDYRLKPTSVCHNAGKNSYVTGALDLAGNARVQEWTVDLGAYEYCPIMTITAAPATATAGTDYSYTLTQTGGEEPVAWTIDAAPETKNVAGEVADGSTFSAAGEKLFDGGAGSSTTFDLPFPFPYGGTTYTRAVICAYGAMTLGNDLWFPSYTGYSNKITDESILSMPVILPYLAYNWGTSGEDGCGVFIDRSVSRQVTIRWATYYGSDRSHANYSMTLYADGAIRFSYGDIDEGYGAPNVVGLSFGDGEHCLDMLKCFGGSNANDILFRPVAIPEGIYLSGNQLVGTPAKGGTYRFRVTATEAGGETQAKTVTMDIVSNYTLKFDGNGNKTGTAPDDKSLTSVEEYVLPEPGMACGCARFLGWATSADGAPAYWPGDAVKGLCPEPNGVVTLYAVWEDVFVVQFDLNAENVLGGHQSYTNTTGASFFVYRTDGATNLVDCGSHEAPCRIGWALDCWNTKADGSGTKVCQNGSWSEKVSAATFGATRGDVITLYAQWQKSAWSFYVPDPQLGDGKWRLDLEGDDSAELGNVSGTVTWPESLTLPAAYRGRTVSSLTYRLQYMSADSQESVRHLVIPEGYANLCAYAFQNLYALESISFPSTLAAIPSYCCYYCTNLASIAFAEGNRSVGAAAFSGCSKLPEVELPRGLTNLATQAFYNCAALTAVVLSPDYVGSTGPSEQFKHSPIAKLEIPASCLGFGWNALEKTAALRFLGDRPTWTVWNANLGCAQLIEYPATNTTWNAGPIANYSTKPHKGFVGPIAAFGITDAYFWTNANETVTFAYAESPLAATVTLPEGAIPWGGVDWEIVGFEADAFDGQPTTVYYPISEYAKWEQVTPPEGITLAPAPGTFFTLTFDANGGDPFVPATMAFPPSGMRALPIATPTRSAYLFLGWAETADGAIAHHPGDDYTAGAAGGSATLFAKWEEVGNYTLHFEGNSANATGVPDNIVTAVGTTPAIPADPVREGWTFAGWTNAVNATVYQSGDTFDEDCAKDTTFTLYAKWTSTTVSNREFVDGNGSTWTYDRTGDAVTLTGFTPGATAIGYTKPSTINGGTVVNRDTFDPKTEYVNGLWWTYSISDNKAKITGYSGTVPANLAIPGTLGGKPVIGFGKQSMFGGENSLVSVEFPATFEQIYRYVCNDCANLETVIFHEGLTTMHDSFSGCPKLNEIDFPASFTHFDNAYCFRSSGTNRPFDENGLRYADTAHEIVIAVDPELEGELVLPEGVRLCTYYVFRDNTKVTSAVLPSTLKLRWNLFYSSAVTAVSVDASVEREGTGTAESTLITDVFVRGGAPSWNLKDYFTGLTTIHYDAKYAVEWSAYKAAYPALTYCDDLVPYATIAFGANGGDGEMPEMTLVECGVSTNLSACTLTQEGYTFVGWALESDGEVEFADGAEITLPVECRKTTVRLFAQWTPVTYAITYDLAGGVNAEANPTNYTVVSAATTLAAPTREGYAFAGWTPTGEIPTGSTGDRTFTAQWTPIVYTITYDLAGGVNAEANPTNYTVEDALTLAAPTRDLYVFTGWTPDGGVIAAGSTGDRAFTANWQRASPDLFDSVAPGALNPKGATYNGFIGGEETLGGTFTLVVKKPKKNQTACAATLTKVDPATGKKVKVSGTVDVNTGLGAGALAGIQLNATGVGGTLGGVAVQGAVNAAKAKDQDALAVMNGFNKQLYGLVFADAAGEEAYLTVTFSTKGKVKVAGSYRGAKVSGSSTMCVGDAVCAVPFVWSKKGVTVTFVLWFDKATRTLVDVSGLGAGATLVDAGLAGGSAATYPFALDEAAVRASVPDAITETFLSLAIRFDGKKFDAGKAAKVSYKKGELTVDTSKGDNVTGLKLSYSKGVLKGSFTVYAVTGGKLVKNKFTVAGVLVDGVGYASGTNKKLKPIPLVLVK